MYMILIVVSNENSIAKATDTGGKHAHMLVVKKIYSQRSIYKLYIYETIIIYLMEWLKHHPPLQNFTFWIKVTKSVFNLNICTHLIVHNSKSPIYTRPTTFT